MTAPGPDSGELTVEVGYALPQRQTVVSLVLPAGATVADALARVADRPPLADLDLAAVPVGVFGDRCERDRPLLHGDRVEIYRPLHMDPREARRGRVVAERVERSRAVGASQSGDHATGDEGAGDEGAGD
jgi:uncharacterized protein